MPRACQGRIFAVENVTTAVPHDGIKPVPIVDVRDIPLGLLPADADARRMVTKLVEKVEGQSRVRVAMFNSAI
jgi:hypothetical protein